MTGQDTNDKQQHAMDEEADVSGGTGGNMGGDLTPGNRPAGKGRGGAGLPESGTGAGAGAGVDDNEAETG